MRKFISCVMIFALCATILPHALAKDEEQPVTVSYDQLTELIIAGNTAYQKELQEIQRLELSYNEISRQYGELNELLLSMDMSMINSQLVDTLSSLRSNMRTARERIDELKDELDSKVQQHVFPAQKMYVSHYILLLDVEISLRELEMLEQELTNCRLKLSRGLITPGEVKSAEKSVDNQKDAVKARRDAVDDNLEALAKYLGLTSAIVLEEIPEIDFDRITERDRDADLAAYILAVSAAAEKALKNAKETFNKNNTSVNRFLYEVALQDFEKARKDAEADFPKVLDTLLEAYDDFVDSTAVADAQDDYDTAASQYAHGLIPYKMLLNNDLILKNTKARYEQQRIRLWLSLMEYEYGLIKFGA